MREYLDKVTKVIKHGRAKPCPYSGFKPMEITEVGVNYSFSDHEYDSQIDTYDCKGCKYSGKGCCGRHYPRAKNQHNVY